MTLRPDLAALAELVPHGARVLDLGCDDGALLAHLARERAVIGRGIELSEAGVLACVRRGLSVRQGNLQEGLADYPAGAFDLVILSQTLPYLDDPARILGDMLRVGRQAIVSLPNWGYWRCRLALLLTGRQPQAPDIPQRWFDTPRWQALTVRDFESFCRHHGVLIQNRRFLSGRRRLGSERDRHWRATTAIYCLTRRDQVKAMSDPLEFGRGHNEADQDS